MFYLSLIDQNKCTSLNIIKTQFNFSVGVHILLDINLYFELFQVQGVTLLKSYYNAYNSTRTIWCYKPNGD